MKPYPDMNKESNEHLPSAKFPVPLLVLMETDSTNRHLTQLCDEQGTDIPEFMTVIAERQTAGKGQRGNSWESEDCKNITFSFVLYPTFIEARQQFILSQIISLSIKEELDEWAEGISIKWPNDIYVDGKKICGILVETILDPDLKGVIVGIGLNVNNEDFQSMKQITHKEYKISKLAIGLKTFMLIYYNLYQTNQFHKVLEYANSISYLKDQWVEYGDYGEVCFQKLLDDGSVLFVDRQGKTYKQVINEISLHNK